jgi:hypothetical protein
MECFSWKGAVEMTEQRRTITDEWDGTQWASADARRARADDVPRWTLWQWASAPRRSPLVNVAIGDTALSGYGHNPGGQRWAQRAKR